MLYAIRHGETDNNVKRIIQGNKINSPLNENGIKQAELISGKLKDKNITKIYASDLLRTRQTAEIVNKILNVEIVYTSLLQEVDCGIVSGKTIDEVMKIKEFLYIYQNRYKKDNIHFPEGESRNMVVDRVTKFLNTVKKESEEKNVLLVSHGGVLRVVRVVFAGIDEEIPNCKGISFELDNNTNPVNINIFG